MMPTPMPTTRGRPCARASVLALAMSPTNSARRFVACAQRQSLARACDGEWRGERPLVTLARASAHRASVRADARVPSGVETDARVVRAIAMSNARSTTTTTATTTTTGARRRACLRRRRRQVSAHARASFDADAFFASISSSSPYDALGVARGASRDACKRAYKRCAKLNHPDVVNACVDASEEEKDERIMTFLRAKKAYEMLTSSTIGNLNDVKTEAWKSKWREQLRALRREREQAKASRANDYEENNAVGTPEMRAQIEAQIAGLRTQGRRRRSVMKPTVRAWEEPFPPSEDDSYSWNHEVQ